MEFKDRMQVAAPTENPRGFTNGGVQFSETKKDALRYSHDDLSELTAMPELRSADLIASEPLEFLVACLCAQWCETCRNYRAGFEALSMQYPDTDFLWVDIEDDAAWAGDFDVENFPTIVMQRGESVLYAGVMLPQQGHLQRQFDVFRAQTPEEALAYATATQERRGWQAEFNVRAALQER